MPVLKNHKPRRRFGQHFLIDDRVIEQIVAIIAPADGDYLIEIGPGLGALTQVLVHSDATLDVIELDRDLAQTLAQRLGDPTNLRIHTMDALKTDFTELAEGKTLRILGNLPYNISSALLFHLLEHRRVIKDMHFMLQNEVADRLVAKPGSRTYGRLSVMVGLLCQVEKLFLVRPESFSPAPRVDSAVLRLTPRAMPAAPVECLEDFEHVVRQAFSQRRKTLRNALRTLLDETQIRLADIDPGARPETLNLESFAALSNTLSRQS